MSFFECIMAPTIFFALALHSFKTLPYNLMLRTQKKILYLISSFTGFMLCSALPVFAQTGFKGRVIYDKDGQPAAGASIELLKQKKGVYSDRNGYFSLSVSSVAKNDTLQVSMVGYELLKIPVGRAANMDEFVLKEKAKSLQGVTVKTFSTRDVQGSTSESVGFFRSWNTEHTGGEIGRIFRLPYEEYKLDKIRFKVSNMCDTCLIRLRIREVVDEMPGDEILEDSITTTIHKLTLDDKAAEFDISEKNIVFDVPVIFVSFEVLNCRSKTGPSCYFSFAGTEMGDYIFKSKSKTDWRVVKDDYTIYMKLFLRY